MYVVSFVFREGGRLVELGVGACVKIALKGKEHLKI